jgi:hypothetical protein
MQHRLQNCRQSHAQRTDEAVAAIPLMTSESMAAEDGCPEGQKKNKKGDDVVTGYKPPYEKLFADAMVGFLFAGKDIDTLQQVIKLLKSREFDFDMQFTNYRSH